MKLRISLILVISATAFGLFFLSRSTSYQVFGELIERAETDRKIIALTFDDGPTPYATQKILDVLAENRVKGTFYLTGKSISLELNLTRSIVESGHEIGNHSYSHSRMLFRSFGFVKGEVQRTNEIIRSAGFDGEITFRPPYGKKLVVLPFYLSRNEIKTVMWDVAPEKVLGKSAKSNEIADYVVENVRPGSIVLLHVMYKSRSEVLTAVPLIIEGLRYKGYDFVTVSELLATNNR